MAGFEDRVTFRIDEIALAAVATDVDFDGTNSFNLCHWAHALVGVGVLADLDDAVGSVVVDQLRNGGGEGAGGDVGDRLELGTGVAPQLDRKSVV